jgi:uncharacterized protein YcaQ
MNSLSIKQARRLVLASQGIHRENEFGRGCQGLVNVVERLGYVQIDTISVIERAHHHTCWNRVKHYSPSTLESAVEQRKIYEYWSHAAAFLPMRGYRFSLPRKQLFQDGDQHWFKKDLKQMAYVKDRIRAEGELQARDFDQPRAGTDHAWGGHKPAKIALELLFMQGELMVSKRNGFQKVFDLTERVVPENVDQSMPSEQEYFDHLIMTFLNAHGIGTAAEMTYLLKGLKPSIEARCNELVEDQRLVMIDVAGKYYFARSDFEVRLNQKLSRHKVKILSPFDNLLIQRQRMRDLFNFDYQIECYVTAKKRKFGYFVLPFLCGQEFAGRMDAKIDRKTKILTISKLFFESEAHRSCEHELEKSLNGFLKFNGGESLKIEDVLVKGNRKD